MSEVHRYKVQCMFSEGGSKIEYFPYGPSIVMAEAFDAQRLRADTAESERDAAKAESKALAELDDVTIANLGSRLKAAEQRIAAMTECLERMLEDDDMPVHWFAWRIDAALNQKSEGEIHE